MSETLGFAEIEQSINLGQPGVYEIHTRSGIPLKVGISTDLRKRLLQHRASRQSGLKLKLGGKWSEPRDVESKKSVLAKHLFYDSLISPSHDLTSEAGRRVFLETCCLITVERTASKEEARELERSREATGAFRYIGDVVVRG